MSKITQPFVFFDAGNVLVRRPESEATMIMRELDLPVEDYEPLIQSVVASMGEVAKGYDKIRTYNDEVTYLDVFHTSLLTYLGRQAEKAQIRRLTDCRVLGATVLADGVLGVLSLLKEAGIGMGVLSNAPPSRRTVQLADAGILDLLDPIIISAEEGLAKPNEAIYHLAQKRAGVAAENIVFVDDKESYLDGAVGAGWIHMVRMVLPDTEPTKYTPISSLTALPAVMGLSQ